MRLLPWMRPRRLCATLVFTAATTLSAAPQAGAPATADAKAAFERTVRPLLEKSCAGCHNDRMASGSLNLGPYAAFSSVTESRDGWERILHKVRTGEMPPKGIPRPTEADVAAMNKLITGEFEKADKLVKPDPGRVTARRLNRNEYTNTVRDLLAVNFRADRDFPTDDSGHGFDNIGDVLTVSPILMEKYMRAAERIASQAIGGNPLPKKPVDAEFHSKDKNILRIDRSTIQAEHRLEWDGEYTVRIGMPGERAKDAAPVQLGFWMDGKLLHQQTVETKPSGLVYFNPYSEAEFKLVLPEGDHTFRAGFIGDEFVKTLDDKSAYSDKKNKFLNMIKFIGPFPAARIDKESRKRVLICDPATGDACVDKILTSLARRAYRRPVTRAEVASLKRFVALAKTEGRTPEQGIQLAIQAMLVSPHFLFRVERDLYPNDPARSYKINSLELASRISYFLWSSMPDDELLTLAESGKLVQPAVMDAQIKRMLADNRSAAFAANFAGQWLETRNLDSVKPDPGKFPEWGPELRDAMKAETRLFFEHMLKENRPRVEFIDSNYTFLNERLAKHYGIDGVTGGDFRRVDLITNQRGGVLGHAGVLTVSSYPTRTSPVIRGKYVLQNVLGVPPPVPPPDVPPLDEAQVGAAVSLRQGLEKHRSNAVCASCHQRMDTLGFGLENYDAIGRWRTKDGKFDIDVSGAFPNGKSFNTPADMRKLLRDDLPEFARCLTEKMLTYALGRGLERYDRKTVEGITRKLSEQGYPFQTMVFEIARSLPFQWRRGEVSKKSVEPASKPAAQPVAKNKEIARR
ncbi:MAG: DUF1592 domain-containing protein [Bryobacterales bacterium]|nr:DUF1592 domain-containing protein [Bryobacterales bacterium]